MRLYRRVGVESSVPSLRLSGGLGLEEQPPFASEIESSCTQPKASPVQLCICSETSSVTVALKGVLASYITATTCANR